MKAWLSETLLRWSGWSFWGPANSKRRKLMPWQLVIVSGLAVGIISNAAHLSNNRTFLLGGVTVAIVVFSALPVRFGPLLPPETESPGGATGQDEDRAP